MRIIGLQVENIKKVKAVEISPTGPIIKLSGDNGAGKSSILDSIAYAIGGKRLIPDDPIRKGEAEAEITVELDDLIVTRKFKRKDKDYTTTLKVMAKDGATYGNGQEVLDALIGKLSFDPFEFSRMSEREQAELLKGMVDLGIDLTQWEAVYKALYQERTIARREADRLKAAATFMPKHEGVPDRETPASAIAEEYHAATEAHTTERQRIAAIVSAISEQDRLLAEVEQLELQVEAAQSALNGAVAVTKRLKEISPVECPDLAEIKSRMDSIEDVNAKVRANRDRSKAVKDANTAIQKRKDLDTAVAEKLSEKETAIRNAKYPVDGLAFEGDSLTYGGIPLSQTGSGEQILISARIGMALNPNLKVLLIRNASLIGTNNFELLSNLAAENGYQMWCEYVDTTGDIGIYIEDGEIKSKT